MNKQHNTILNQLSRPLSIIGGTALASSANAALVQIDLTGNTITSGGGDQLFADLDFDGTSDLTFNSISNGYAVNAGPYSGFYYFAEVNINGEGRNLAVSSSFSGGSGVPSASIGGTVAFEGFIQAEFSGSDLGTHQGFLEVAATFGGTNTGISIVRFIYDDESPTLAEGDINHNTQYTSIGSTSASGTTIEPVPEPSSLGLLALGAGGLALRRRRKAA